MRESARLSLEERRAKGAQARQEAPRSSAAGWSSATDRPDPVSLLEAQDLTREPDLVPVRYGRMMVSPFTFYRGAAKIMAADLASMPAAGLGVQLCGDAHLLNFGAYASPERRLVFDLNDFDETLPGPFEYDVKRMAASFTIAARDNGYSSADIRTSTLASVTAYREAMTRFAGMRTLDIWYARLPEDELMAAVRGTVAEMARTAKGKHGKKKAKAAEKTARRGEKMARKARTRDSLQALSKLGELAGGRYRIVSQPPVVVPARDLAATYGISPEEIGQAIREQFRAYRATLQRDRRRLLERFEIVDMARKIVGVGSVGTRAYIVLLQGRDADDPLFLQIKEATASVLEDHLPTSRFAQPGERVVQGQRMMQAVSDIFLGWTKGAEQGRYFYWRQLRDMKGSTDVASMRPAALAFYARMCGWTLARAHARSGDPVAIAGYLGGTEEFDQAVTGFSLAYADQNERDFEDFIKAIRSGRLEARDGVLSSPGTGVTPGLIWSPVATRRRSRLRRWAWASRPCTSRVPAATLPTGLVAVPAVGSAVIAATELLRLVIPRAAAALTSVAGLAFVVVLLGWYLPRLARNRPVKPRHAGDRHGQLFLVLMGLSFLRVAFGTDPKYGVEYLAVIGAFTAGFALWSIYVDGVLPLGFPVRACPQRGWLVAQLGLGLALGVTVAAALASVRVYCRGPAWIRHWPPGSWPRLPRRPGADGQPGIPAAGQRDRAGCHRVRAAAP